jgi:hypothetical protein
VASFWLMANIDEKKAPVPGEGNEERKHAEEAPALPRDASRTPEIEEPDDAFDQPAPKRRSDDDNTEEDPDKRKADSDFDDLDIEIDESEVESELRGQPRRKY